MADLKWVLTLYRSGARKTGISQTLFSGVCCLKYVAWFAKLTIPLG